MADDSEDNRFLILSYLNMVGASIDIAVEDGEIAVNFGFKFRANKYDVVLMDAEMPVMDGFTATRNIRQFEKETGASVHARSRPDRACFRGCPGREVVCRRLRVTELPTQASNPQSRPHGGSCRYNTRPADETPAA